MVTVRDELLTDRARKNLEILDAIRRGGPLTKTEISKVTKYNIVTVSNYVENFIERNLVVERGFAASEGGRRPMMIELNPRAGYVVGVGINLLNLVGVVVDLAGKIVFKVKRYRPAVRTIELIERLADVVEELLRDAKVDRAVIRGIGVGVPGIIDDLGHTIRWPGKPGDKDVFVSVSIRELFEKRFDIPTYAENDATAAVFGEWWLGLRPDVRNMLYMYSGVGTGIMINGQIYRGTSGCAGELGISTSSGVDAEAWRRESVGLGRWEVDLGLVWRAREALVAERASAILDHAKDRDADQLDAQAIFQAAKAGDALAVNLIKEVSFHLGRRIAFLVNFLNPEIVVIGGGIEEAGELLLDTVRETVRAWSVEEASRIVKVVPARLGEDSIALGAASVVTQNLFTEI